MRGKTGKGYTFPLKDNHRCDIVVFVGKLFDEVDYDIWHNDDAMAKYRNSVKFFRWEVLLGRNSEITHRIAKSKWLKVFNDINEKIKLLGIDDEIKLKKLKH